jgi:hypothetical protein
MQGPEVLASLKLVDKHRVGSKVCKTYDKPRSPCQRLTASPDIWVEVKEELGRRYRSCNPVFLQQELHRAVDALMEISRWKDLLRRQPLSGTSRGKILF